MKEFNWTKFNCYDVHIFDGKENHVCQDNGNIYIYLNPPFLKILVQEFSLDKSIWKSV